MDKKDTEKIIKVAEELDWSVQIDGNEFMFKKYSPAGQDFDMTITINSIEDASIEDAVKKIRERCDNFDCSEEAYFWLDNTGHGMNGAPYDMKDLYEDMESCLEMMKELHDKLEKINK